MPITCPRRTSREIRDKERWPNLVGQRMNGDGIGCLRTAVLRQKLGQKKRPLHPREMPNGPRPRPKGAISSRVAASATGVLSKGVFVVLGPKWKDTSAIIRLLAPAIALFAIINPLEWLIFSIGLEARSLKIALVFAPFMITSYIIGLPYGPKGVAFAYSAVLTLWLIPRALWCLHGTVISAPC